MNAESFPCQLVSWNETCRLAKILSQRIKSSGYQPDLVIAIGRGGYVPARIVCDFLLHNLLTSIKIEHWGIAAQKKEDVVVRFPLSVDINGLRVLIVDDVTDTGDTLKAAVSYVGGLKAGEIRTAVLQHKVSSSFVPDYCAEVVTEWRWIIYPWAAHEDLVGFTERMLSCNPHSVEDIRASLREHYGLEVDEEQLCELLGELIEMGKAERVGDMYKSL